MPHRSRWTGGAGWGAVACTRKNVQGTKRFAVAAVKAGGAVMHRLGLSETVLVFPEHCAFLGKEPFVGLAEKLRRAAPEKRGIHAGNVAAYAQAGADVVVTSSPYLAKPRDVQVRIGPAVDDR